MSKFIMIDERIKPIILFNNIRECSEAHKRLESKRLKVLRYDEFLKLMLVENAKEANRITPLGGSVCITNDSLSMFIHGGDKYYYQYPYHWLFPAKKG